MFLFIVSPENTENACDLQGESDLHIREESEMNLTIQIVS